MSGRTLYEIIALAKDGGKPEYDELLYGLLALDVLGAFDREFIMSLPAKAARQRHLNIWAEESFQRYKRALEKPPREWLGPGFDPANPHVQDARRTALALLEKLIDGGFRGEEK